MLAILSDIHSNLQALEAVLEECRRRGVTGYCCLGDIVGYGANPVECVQRIRALACPVVQGNHDHYAAIGTLDNDVSPLARSGIEYSMSQLSEEDRAWLLGLPAVLRLSDVVTVVHSSLHEPAEWHYVRIGRMAEDSFEHQETPVCFCGHTHVSQVYHRVQGGRPEMIEGEQYQLQRGEHYLINPGSVGQPRNGDPRAQFALFDPASLKLELASVVYDIEGAVRAIRAAGLPEPLGERLREGY